MKKALILVSLLAGLGMAACGDIRLVSSVSSQAPSSSQTPSSAETPSSQGPASSDAASSKPAEASSTPVESSKPAEESSKEPEGTSLAPEQSSALPEGSSKQEESSAPVEVSSDEGESEPVYSEPEASSEPIEESSEPVEESSESAETSEPAETSESAETSEPAVSSQPAASSKGQEELNPYVGIPAYDGESATFPAAAMSDFLEWTDMNVDLPSPTGGDAWLYEQGTEYGWTCFYAFTEDEGTPGVNAIEDTYKAALEDAGFTVDDSNYDNAGYIVMDETCPELEITFYTYDGYFEFYLYGPWGGNITEGYPVGVVADYISDYGAEYEVTCLPEEVVAPDFEGTWFTYSYPGEYAYVESFAEGATEDDLDAFLAKCDATYECEIDDYSEYYGAPTFFIEYLFKESFYVQIFAWIDEDQLAIQVSLSE